MRSNKGLVSEEIRLTVAYVTTLSEDPASGTKLCISTVLLPCQ